MPVITAIDFAAGYVPPTVRRPGEYYWAAHLASAKAVYARYAVCAEMPGRPFETAAEEAVRYLDSHPTDTLIVDVRGNTGGPVVHSPCPADPGGDAAD